MLRRGFLVLVGAVLVALSLPGGYVLAEENSLQSQQSQSPQGGAASSNEVGAILQAPAAVTGLQSAEVADTGATQAGTDSSLQQGASADQAKLFIQGDVDSVPLKGSFELPFWAEVAAGLSVAVGAAGTALVLLRRRYTSHQNSK